jgi:hypothetical protein
VISISTLDSALSTGSGNGHSAVRPSPHPCRGPRAMALSSRRKPLQLAKSKGCRAAQPYRTCRRNTCSNFERPARFPMSPSRHRQLEAAPGRAQSSQRILSLSCEHAPMVSTCCGVSEKGASPNLSRSKLPLWPHLSDLLAAALAERSVLCDRLQDLRRRFIEADGPWITFSFLGRLHLR